MVASTGLSGSCGSSALHAQPALCWAYWSVQYSLSSVQLLSCAAFPPFPPLPPQSLSIQGEPQGIQWQLNTFLWIDFKALFPLGPSGRGSERRRGEEEELCVTLCIAVPGRARFPQFSDKDQQLAVVCASPACWSQDASTQRASRSYHFSSWWWIARCHLSVFCFALALSHFLRGKLMAATVVKNVD